MSRVAECPGDRTDMAIHRSAVRQRTAPRRAIPGDRLRAELHEDGKWYAVNVERPSVAVPCGAVTYLAGCVANLTLEEIDKNLRLMLEAEIGIVQHLIDS